MESLRGPKSQYATRSYPISTCGREAITPFVASCPPPAPPSQAASRHARGVRALWLSFLGASLLVSAAVPLSGKTDLGTLSGRYTDHVRQPYAAWVFFHRGFSLYTTPLGVVSQGLSHPQATTVWADVPYVYPPGVFFFYAPLALLGWAVPMSHQTFGQLAVLYLLLWSHVALFGLFRGLERSPPGARFFVGGFAWMVFVRLALAGQYDAVWIACAAVAFTRARDGEGGSAIRWISLAALLHYRAIILAPLGLLALLQATRGRQPRDWPWRTLAFVAAVGGVCLVTFAAMAPGAAEGGAAFPPRWSGSGAAYPVSLILVSSLATALVAYLLADLLVAGTVLVGCALVFIDTHLWWHASLLLAAPLAAGVVRTEARRAAVLRGATLVWLITLQMNAWGGNPMWLFKEVKHFLRSHLS